MIQKVPPFKKLKEGRDEIVLEPDLEIIDTHHHLFDRPHLRYMLDEYLEDVALGHKVIATVYSETQAFARKTGDEALRPVGEIEFANGVAAICASGDYGPCRVAAGIVGYADLRLGDAVAATLDASMAASPERYRGIRQIAIDDPNPAAIRFLTHRPPPGLLQNAVFRAGARHVASRGLTFDAAVLHHQLPELAQFADENEDLSIILNHAGLAMCMEATPEARAEVHKLWRANMIEIAKRPNMTCKIGGLGTSYWGFGVINRDEVMGYEELAEIWRPYVEGAVEIFGPERCMMESNFPNDGRTSGFVPLWNAMKHILKGHSASEKAAIFSGTAKRVYRLNLD